MKERRIMICPYNGFKKCDWENCAARMLVKDQSRSGHLMKVCAIAYNGGDAPKFKQEDNND